MRTQSRAVVPLLILIVIALFFLLLARADAAGPEEVRAGLRAAGGKLAYGDAEGRVYLIDPEVTEPEWIGYGRSLTWSPDGREVVIGTHARLDLRTGQKRTLLAASQELSLDQAQWVTGPDRLLLFSSQEPGIYLGGEMPPLNPPRGQGGGQSSPGPSPDGDPELLVPDGSLGLHGPQCVSPDGTRLAFVRRDEEDTLASVWILDLTTGEEMPVELPRRDDIVRDYVYNFAWSPTGEEVLFTWATATDAGSGPPTRLQIMRVGRNDGLLRPFVPLHNETNVSQPAWSPDGGTVAYIRMDSDATLRPTISLGLLDRATLISSSLCDLPAGDVLTSQLTWSPDGQVLFFSVRDAHTGVSSLRLVMRDGREAQIQASSGELSRTEEDLYSLGWLPYAGDIQQQSLPTAPPDSWPGTEPAERGDVLAQVTYDRAGATGYALTHCLTETMYCPVGISYAGDSERCASGGDCAHFVSHCLYEGGLSNFGSIGVGHDLAGNYCYVTGGTIIRASNQHDWVLSGGRGTARSSATQLDQGDVVAYDWDGVNSWNHVVMVVQNDGLGDVRVASHTSYGCDFDWSMGGAEVYEFIHVLAPPAAPRLPTPGAGAHISDTTPALSWAAVGTSHHVQVSTESGFNTPLIDEGGLLTPAYGVTTSLSPGTYYWRAQVSSADGTSPWSATWQFVMEEPCPRPPAPALLSPPDEHTACAGSTLTLTWTEVLTATGYWVEWVDATPVTQTIAATGLSVTLPTTLTAGHYEWRLRSENECGVGPWSGGRTVDLVAMPDPPALHTPPDEARTLDTTPLFAWDAATVGALNWAPTFTLQVSGVPGFVPLVLETPVAGTAYTPSVPLALGDYFWRVRGHNVCGSGDWADADTFQLVEAVPVYLPLVFKSPPPPPCEERVANGGFESDEAWTRSGLRPPTYTTAEAHSGARSLLHGTLPPAVDSNAYSSAYQPLTLPAATSATLSFWVKRRTDDTGGDAQQALVLNDSLGVDRVLMNTLSDDGQWTHASYDLSEYLGRTIYLYFNVTNDGDGARTWMYLDDVSLQVCQ